MPKKAKSKRSRPTAKNGVNRSEFVRTMPNAKAGEVVEAARAKGIKLSPGLVYAVRAAEKKKRGVSKGKPGRKPGFKVRSTAQAIGGHNAEATIRRLALTVGIVRVNEIVEKIRAEAGL